MSAHKLGPSDRVISERIVYGARTVRDYLVNAYQVDVSVIDEALQTPEAREEIAQAVKVRSFAFYPGDRIAREQGWEENPDFDPDSDDDEDEATA